MTGSLAMELWFGEVEIFMWVSLSTLSEQEMGHNILLMVINMKDNLNLEQSMYLENTHMPKIIRTIMTSTLESLKKI